MSDKFRCWTEGAPATFRCRERGHDVRESSPDTPATSAPDWDAMQDPAEHAARRASDPGA